MPLFQRQGARNEPAYIPEVLMELSMLKQMSPDMLCEAIERNVEKMFRIPVQK